MSGDPGTPGPSRRELLAQLSLGGLGVAAGLGCGRRGPSSKPPIEPCNVLIIVSDEHNASIMGCAGDTSVRTPSLDALASQGVRLTNAYAASPVCAPSRQSLFTGLWPNEHGQWANHVVFDERVPTMAPVFKAAGYHTACIGKTHTNNPGQTWGFDQYWGRDSAEWRKVSKTHPSAKKQPAPWGDDRELFKAIPDRRLRGRPQLGQDSRDGATWLELTTRFLREAPKQPWLCYTSFSAPHHPWDLPESYYWMYDPASLPMPQDWTEDLSGSPVAQATREQNRWANMDEAAHRLCRARYYGAVSYADSLVGRALGVLDELKLSERTLVVYLSDHGDMVGGKGLWFKSLMYDPAVRIPAIFRLPGQLEPGSVVDGLWSGTDLLSTAAGLAGAGAHVPRSISGRDRSQMLRGKPGYGPEYTFSVLTPRPQGSDPGHLMVRSKQYKLIQYGASPVTDRRPFLEFFDLEKDPLERKNLAKAASFQRQIHEHQTAGKEWLAGQTFSTYEMRRVKGSGEDDEGSAEQDSG